MSQSKMMGGGGMSTPIFSSKAKAVRPPSCTRRRRHSLSFSFAMTLPPPPTPWQVVKMPKEVLRSAIASRCSAAVVADAAAAAPPPASPSKLKAPAGEGGRGAAPDTTAPPPRPPTCRPATEARCCGCTWRSSHPPSCRQLPPALVCFVFVLCLTRLPFACSRFSRT